MRKLYVQLCPPPSTGDICFERAMKVFVTGVLRVAAPI
jgi:hypothetical protein